jgi:hypothetical protein
MNALAHKCLVPAILTSSPSCPAEAVGRQIAAAERRLHELDQAFVAGCEYRGSARREFLHLEDIRATLDRQLETTQAESLTGLFWQVVQLGMLFEELSQELVGEETNHPAVRAFDRLHNLVVRGFEGIGGLDHQALGMGAKFCGRADIRSALDQLTAA